MSTILNPNPLEAGLDLSDPSHQLILCLRTRLAVMQSAESAASTINPKGNSTKKPHEQNIAPKAEMTGLQPLTVGTMPGQCRDDAGTATEHPAGIAGTTSTEPNPRLKPKRSPTESPLTELTPEIQARILELLDIYSLDRATLEITSAPPYGLGIDTSRSSLDRFHRRHKNALLAREREQRASETARLVAEAKTMEDIPDVARHLIELRLLESATTDNANPSHLLALTRALDRLNAARFAERRLRLAESKAAQPRANSPSISSVESIPSI